MGATSIPFQIFSGDLNARSLEEVQPAKYAAMEGVITSGNGKPLYIGKSSILHQGRFIMLSKFHMERV